MLDRADLLSDDPDEWIEIGFAVNVRVADDHGHLALIIAHPPGRQLPYQIDGWCYGSITTHPDANPNWDLVSRHPLTLSPSILCDCGHHGYIRDWKWVPA